MIQIHNLKKSYNKSLVVSIDNLEIPQGQSFGLVGNNGAGKTTLFRLILDLIRSNEGTVTIEDHFVNQSEEWKKFTGSFIDEKFLIDYLTPDEYFKFLSSLYGINQTDLSAFLERFRELFNEEILGKKKYIRDLSKGNKKKVGIASALIGNPSVVLLDEPFENLDPTSQFRLKRLIGEFKQDHKVTFLISSHDLNHVTEICDRIVILEKGEVHTDLSVNEQTLAQLNEYFSGSLKVDVM